jgi:hypothetical protein
LTPFRVPLPGETPTETKDRQEEMIRFLIARHQWPRADVESMLDSLDPRGLSHVREDMRAALRASATRAYAPFKSGWES